MAISNNTHLREKFNKKIPNPFSIFSYKIIVNILADVPSVILSALSSLADALGVYVTSTLWDRSFRQALVASKRVCNGETGQLFCNVIQELVTLSNLFEVTPEWILGAPLDELPLVEQIPVLHRLGKNNYTNNILILTEFN